MNGVSPALQVLRSERPLVIGHRGYSQFAPENTLVAFKMALAAGVDLVELDYHHSSDRKLVVIHDSELDRTTDATVRWNEEGIKVASRTAAEIQSLDAGSWFDAKHAGARVPLLEEALDLIQKNNVALIERKTGDAGACAQILRQKGLLNRVIIQAFDWDYLRAFNVLEPTQVLGALGPPNKLADGRAPAGLTKELNVAWLDELEKTGAHVAVWNQQVSQPAIQAAHERGLKVWVYTINFADAANRLLDLGVDGIITNNPAVIWKALALWRR
jgi:glycerophosphoryl diester phosphodiesterase